MHPSKTSAFFFCRSNILSSMVSAVQNRVAITGRVCPIRCARITACISTAGFHQGSSTKTRFAVCRFKPSPPDLRLIRITVTLGSSRNARRFAARCVTGMEPSSLAITKFSFFKRHSTISIMFVYWLKTMALFGAARARSVVSRVRSSSRISRRPRSNASTFVLLVYLLRSMRDKMDFEGSSPRFVAAADAPPPPARRARVRSEGCRSTVNGTRHVGHVTFSPVSGAQDAYCMMHSRWNTCLHPVMAASSGSTSSWHMPQ
mmetsp:Transcript_15251/g.65311  ORF Transcript_15251/g.65311 Transcript_15251/m.65311 type:complete len:260 (+) Transcript_15251:202-981(+)